MDTRLCYCMMFILLALKSCACGTTKAALPLTETNTSVLVRQEGTNIAIGQNTSQKQSLFYNDFMWTSDKAVDGCHDRLSPDVSKCCSSSESAVFIENFWRVDFDVVYSLIKVVVYGRGDFGSQLDNFTLYINDTNRTPLYNATGVPFTDGIYEIILEPEVLASSIIVTRQTGRYITLCEVEAIAVPTTLPTTEFRTTQTSSEATTLVSTHEITRGTSHRTTEESIKGSTRVSTESSSQASTEGPTQLPTESSSQALTQGPTQGPTESSSQSSTQGPTQGPTESSSQSSTQGPTQGPTESSSQASTEDTTEMSIDISTQTPKHVSTQGHTYTSRHTQGSTMETTYASSRDPTHVPSESTTRSSDTTVNPTKESTQMPSQETTLFSTTDTIQGTTRNSSLGQTQSATGSGISTPAIVGITLGVLAVSVLVVIALVWKLSKSSAVFAMSGLQSDKTPANSHFHR